MKIVEAAFSIDASDKTLVKLQLKSDLLDIASIVANHEQLESKVVNATSGTDPTDDGRVIPVAAVPSELLAAFNAEVDIDISKLITRVAVLTDFRVDATLKDSALDIFRLSGDSKRGNLQAKISLTPENGKSRLKFAATATGVIFDIPGLTVADPSNQAGLSGDIEISALGNGLRDFASTMDGFIWIQGADRRIENLGFTRLFSDFLGQLYTTLNPFAKEESYTEIVCDLYFLEAENGILKTAPALFIRTDKINIAAEGKIDLTDESIDFKFATSPRRGIGLSASDLTNPFIRVDGTLAKPGIALNKTGALVEGGAAVATVGLSIVAKGLWKRWLGPRKPCEKMLEEATKVRLEKEPGFVPGQLAQ